MILFLPKWYPSRLDPQLGIFIRKHALAASCYDRITVLSIQADPCLSASMEVCENLEGTVKEVWVYYKKFPGAAATLVNGIRYLRAFRSGWKHIKKREGVPALVHSHVFLRTVLTGYLISRKFRIPLVISEHWTGFLYGAYQDKPYCYKVLCRKICKKAAALTVVSEALLSAMSKNGLQHDHTCLIPNVIDVKYQGKVSGKVPGRVSILTVADLVDRNKNISGALQVMQKVVREHPQVEYHIIGGGIDEIPIHKLALQLDPANQWIHFHGRRDNSYVLGFIQTVDFVLINSNIETFSVFAAESLALGKPVVATISGGPENFINENNGILIPPGNPDLLEQALNQMIGQYDQYDPVSLSAEINTKFGMKTVGNLFSKLYEGILKDG